MGSKEIALTDVYSTGVAVIFLLGVATAMEHVKWPRPKQWQSSASTESMLRVVIVIYLVLWWAISDFQSQA